MQQKSKRVPVLKYYQKSYSSFRLSGVLHSNIEAAVAGIVVVAAAIHSVVPALVHVQG
jgi:hypothetical protein